jgi:hypothetical protein
MTSIIKVDQIQTAAGTVPTVGDLGINVTGGNLPVGSVLQVKHHTIDPGTGSTTSQSLIETGLTVTITPRDANSKFLLLASMHECYVAASGRAIGFALARNGSRLYDTDGATLGYTASGGANYFNVNLQAYDSPATNSQVTYSVMVKSMYGTSVSWNGDNTPTFFTVMEIAG